MYGDGVGNTVVKNSSP